MKYEFEIRGQRIILEGDDLLPALEFIVRSIELDMEFNDDMTQHAKGMVAGCLRAAKRTAEEELARAKAMAPRPRRV